MAGYKDHVFIDDLKFLATRKKGGGIRRLDFAFEVHIPGVRGPMDAKRTGKILAAEVIDYLRHAWERGFDARGRKQDVRLSTRAWRKNQAAVLTGTADFGDRKLEKWKKEIKRQYYYRGKSYAGPDFVAGLKTREYGKGKVYIPRPNNPALNASGLMLNSLQGKYVPDANYVNRKGKRIVSKSSVKIRVAGSRGLAAYIYGGMDQTAAFMNFRASSGVFRNLFPATSEYLDHLIYINDPDNVTKYLERVVRFLQFVNKNKALLL